ncbi:MAG: helix-turn-helix domain-containing protein [Pyrinomonadaceae bacterium MAG19_C2-C3]|nr:helix-turn-helix domain-containing protein [Pyrinomonadaceae bacterium MAG19_C2-C3]
MSKQKFEKQYFTEAEAGIYTGLSRETLRLKRQAGTLGYCRFGRKVMYARRHLDALFIAHEKAAEREPRPLRAINHSLN